MGAKRTMLGNGLASTIADQVGPARRFVDLFCGTGIVSWFVAQHYPVPVIATDLQKYATVLAASVITRNDAIDASDLKTMWVNQAEINRDNNPNWGRALKVDSIADDAKRVADARMLCRQNNSSGPVWGAYGGHYFSPSQSLTIDHLLRALPSAEPYRSVALASLIVAASQCAASPGHTAQPFQPTATALPHLIEAWSRDPIDQCMKALSDIGPRRAQILGESFVCDASQMSSQLTDQDLVFIDPPYSSVQYSRFYHVLETIARGGVSQLAGTGRYPPLSERPQSDFSLKSRSHGAFSCLMRQIASASARVILTFPAGRSSNGLSGTSVKSIAEEWFNVEDITVTGKFSTLGGNNHVRASRALSEELILVLSPK